MLPTDMRRYQILFSAALGAEANGMHADADKLFGKARLLAESTGVSSLEGMLLHFAQRCAERGRYLEAESFYLEAMEKLSKNLGSDSLPSGLIMRELAELYRAQGRTEESDRWKSNSTKILKKHFWG